MNVAINLYFIVSYRMMIFLLGIIIGCIKPTQGQNYEAKSAVCNTLLGGFSGGVGAVINKHPNQKWYQAFGRGFFTGGCGGVVMYGGKKLNFLVADKQKLGYAWLSRTVFSAGNSIVENASSNIDFWSRWHFDIGFIRLEFKTGPFNFTPRIMPSTLGGTIFLAANGKFNFDETMRSGTLTFRTPQISYAPELNASTPTNGFVIIDSLNGQDFYNIYAHEMVHTFQFQEASGVNYFLLPVSNKWRAKSIRYTKWSKWVYLDINYELFLANYFLIQSGYKSGYCSNFLENEAEILSTGRPACK